MMDYFKKLFRKQKANDNEDLKYTDGLTELKNANTTYPTTVHNESEKPSQRKYGSTGNTKHPKSYLSKLSVSELPITVTAQKPEPKIQIRPADPSSKEPQTNNQNSEIYYIKINPLDNNTEIDPNDIP